MKVTFAKKKLRERERERVGWNELILMKQTQKIFHFSDHFNMFFILNEWM